MGARWYDPQLARWASADSIVPQPGNPQSLNRYSYVHNNPVRYYDSDGHCLPFCISTYLAMRSIPREYAGAGARFVANQGLPGVSDVAAFDAANMDNMWLAVNGDKVGLTAEQRAVAYAKGTGGAILEAAAVYGGVALGARAIAGAKALPDLVRGLTQNDKASEIVKRADFTDKFKAFEHYAKHVKGIVLKQNGQYLLKKGGADMPEFESLTEYSDAASSFMSGAPGNGVMQFTRQSGDIVRFDLNTGYFGVKTANDVIRTFFRPAGDLQKQLGYFWEQIGK